MCERVVNYLTSFKNMLVIGKTPLLKLERLSEPGCAEIYVKYEGTNPTGSMKDRMALSMIEGAEKRGELKPGGTVMDYTGEVRGVLSRWSAPRKAIARTLFPQMLLLRKNFRP